MESTISLTDPTCTGERAGGKGANLGRLTVAGLSVPGGFVIPTDVYARFVDESGIRSELLDMVSALDLDEAQRWSHRRRRSATSSSPGTCPRTSAVTSPRRTGVSAPNVTWRCARPGPPKTSPGHPSPGSTTRTSTSSVPTRSSTRSSGAAGVAVDLDGATGGEDIEDTEDTEDGRLVGLPMSKGAASGRARVVPDLAEIGRVEKGDILICNATDPGWASVFSLIADGACLAREHGIPALQRNAMKLIPDGATVELRGETGEMRVIE
jgi:predicted aconitase with swiveling domain